jgi:molecular chaperone GrpE
MDIFKKLFDKMSNEEKDLQNEVPATEQEQTPEVNTENTENKENNPATETAANDQSAESEIGRLKQQLAEANDKYLRLYSEFDNYRKRTSRERIDLLKTAGEDVIKSLLPILDDFERAVKSNETAADIAAVNEGVKLVQQKFRNLLQHKGLEAMSTIGQPFDTDMHEAITNIPAPSDDMKGKVVDELEKGYLLGGKVIRFAKVIVGN